MTVWFVRRFLPPRPWYTLIDGVGHQDIPPRFLPPEPPLEGTVPSSRPTRPPLPSEGELDEAVYEVVGRDADGGGGGDSDGGGGGGALALCRAGPLAAETVTYAGPHTVHGNTAHRKCFTLTLYAPPYRSANAYTDEGHLSKVEIPTHLNGGDEGSARCSAAGGSLTDLTFEGARLIRPEQSAAAARSASPSSSSSCTSTSASDSPSSAPPVAPPRVPLHSPVRARFVPQVIHIDPYA